MARTTRTFIALPVPSALGEKLTRLQSLLAPKVPAARWSSSPPFHMTLAFLGDVPDNDLNTVCKAVAEASLPFSPFELRLESVGAFPNPAPPRALGRPDGSRPFTALRVAESDRQRGNRCRLSTRRSAIHSPCDPGADPIAIDEARIPWT